MSLINQMLRDLDQREGADETPRVIKTPQPVPGRAKGKKHSRVIVWMVLIVVLIVPLIYLQPQMAPFFSSLLDPVSAPVPADTPTSSVGFEATPMQTTLPEQEITNTIPADPAKPVTIQKQTTEDKAVVMVEQAEQVKQQTETVQVTDEPESKPLLEQRLPAAPIKDSTQLTDRDQPAEQLLAKSLGDLSSLEYKKRDSAEDKKVAITSPWVKPEPEQVVAVPVTQKTRSVIESPPMKPQIQFKKVPAAQVKASADEMYEAALLHLNEGRLADAEASLLHVLSLDRDNHEARRLLAMLSLNTGERERFFSLLTEGMQIAPGYVPFALLLSRAFIESGEQNKAIGLLEQQLPISGSDVDLLAMLGSLYQQAGRFSAAVQIYRRLVAQQSNNARAIAGLAISLDANGEQEEALKLYRQALNLNALPDEVTEYARQRVMSLSAER
ncbi:MAG: hypothetical protein OQL27_03165 [Sedimenticola sp.]|nr:hypothetical protein [Sedimenticola sp.]